MSGNALINVSALPTSYAVSSSNGGHFCAGGAGETIILTNSDPGTFYQAYRGTSAVGSLVLSTGGTLVFGPFNTPGIYTVKGTDGISGCTGIMSGSITIIIDPLPIVYAVTGGGGYCAGGAGLHVGLGYSSIGIDYQLWYSGGMISSLHGSGSGLDFGIQSATGSYSVIAVNSTSGCSSAMSGSANIGINPLPGAYNVTGGGNYCLGSTGPAIGMDMSDVGINYQLYRGITPVGTAAAGTGGNFDFGAFAAPGTYSVIATNATTGCVMMQAGTVTVSVNPLPVIHTVSGGGNYCLGGAGVDVILIGSNTGTTYELYLNGVGTGLLQSGTGTNLDFGVLTTTGIYTVVATNDLTGCVRNMAGSATIGIYSLPNAFNVTGGGEYCAGGSGIHIGLDGSTSGVRYQLYNTSGPVGSAMSGTGRALDFGSQTASSTFTVVGTSVLTGCTNAMSGNASVIIDPLPQSIQYQAVAIYVPAVQWISSFLILMKALRTSYIAVLPLWAGPCRVPVPYWILVLIPSQEFIRSLQQMI